MLYPGSTHDVVLPKLLDMLAEIRVVNRSDKSAHAHHLVWVPFSLGHMGQSDQVKQSHINVYRYFLLMLLNSWNRLPITAIFILNRCDFSTAICNYFNS